jgi:ABC-type multidrug transport system ATPase subunit
MSISLKNVSPVNIRLRDVSVYAKPRSDIWSDVGGFFTSGASRPSKVSPHLIVDDVSADLPAGSFTAILGSSGSGKTTLLNAVAARTTSKYMTVTGNVTFNGIEDPNRVRSAYVMQDDVLLPTLTVRETLQYAVDLRLQSLSTRTERDALVEETIMELGLKECADTRIGSSTNGLCSGGEKRRASIGVQLLANPSVLFCDEPTTGE